MQTKITAKDFFLHIAIIALLYTGVVALLNLLFKVINTAFPQVERYRDIYYHGSPISLPIATLIVVFPIFLFLVNLLHKGYASSPEKRDLPIRKWLIYVTLFVAGAVLAGDLVTLIYYFLDGRELTTAFILKILAVLLVAGGVFGYYYDDLRDRHTGRRRTLWRLGASAIVILSVVAGFVVIGSPATQRAMRQDSQRVQDLQNVQWQIISYWQMKRELPTDMSDLEDSLASHGLPVDPKTGAFYEYERIDELAFRLCADFERASNNVVSISNSAPRIALDMEPIPIKAQNNWEHEAGRTCFDRTIDPDLYPPRISME
jgi:type II secretory pathway pseudopilin PulG